MHVLVTGGCGYVGSVLVPKLLDAGHHVRVIDNMLFRNHLQRHPHLSVVKFDIRDEVTIGGADAIIHLAAIANDPTGELDPKLTWEVNALATMRLADRAARFGVKQFIYASSGSVYGVSHEPMVTENLPLVPLSEYNKTKMVAERVLMSYMNGMAVQIVRPATVCGFSPRMRLDVMVNSLTMQALNTGRIKFNGGDQYRPNIHIDDMTDLYLWLLERPHVTGIYNAGFENLTIKQIAQLVCDKVKCEVEIGETVDPRSYRINSNKLESRGFAPRKTVNDAIDELITQFKAGQLKDETLWHNIKTMKAA